MYKLCMRKAAIAKPMSSTTSSPSSSTAVGVATASSTDAVATDADTDREWSAVALFVECKSKCVVYTFQKMDHKTHGDNFVKS